MWKFQVATNTWLSVLPLKHPNRTRDVATTIQPGGRSGGLSFVGDSGTLWLYGGITAEGNTYCDMWNFSVSDGSWHLASDDPMCATGIRDRYSQELPNYWSYAQKFYYLTGDSGILRFADANSLTLYSVAYVSLFEYDSSASGSGWTNITGIVSGTLPGPLGGMLIVNNNNLGIVWLLGGRSADLSEGSTGLYKMEMSTLSITAQQSAPVSVYARSGIGWLDATGSFYYMTNFTSPPSMP